MIVPRVLFSGDAAAATPWVGFAKKLARVCYDAKIASKTCFPSSGVEIKIENIFPASDKGKGVSRVWIEAESGGKALLAIDAPSFPEHPTYFFYPLVKTPYWVAKEPKGALLLDRRGKGDTGGYQVGDSNWQSVKTAVTWNLFEYGHTYRYYKPRWIKDPNLPNKIYCNRRRSKSLPLNTQVVGAALWTKQIRRFLAVVVDGKGSDESGEVPINVSLYATDRLPSNEDADYGDWELVSELGALDEGWRLETSFFFNQQATEAVAVMTRVALGSSRIATNHRVLISVSISEENVLSATMAIDNPFPSCVETGTIVVDGLVETKTKTWTNLSLAACDYWYRPDLAPDENGNYDRMVYLVFDPASTNTEQVTYEFTQEVEGIDYYGLTNDLNESSGAGSIQVYYDGAPLFSLPVNFSSSSEASWSPIPGQPTEAMLTESYSESNNRYRIYDCDLRGMIFFVSYLDTEVSIPETTVESNAPTGTDYYRAETGSQYFRVFRYDLVSSSLTQLYEHQEIINRSDLRVLQFHIESSFALPYYDTTGYPYTYYYGNSFDSLFGVVYYLWSSFAGHFKCLIQKTAVDGNPAGWFPVFMSSLHLKYGESEDIPANYLYLNYLENADPDVISGAAHDYYYLLTVV